MSMCKQLLGVKKFTSGIKVLSELGRTPLKIDIETKMFKYFQRFPFIETNRYLSKNLFFKKRATDLYLQIFYNYIDNTKNKGFFTCLKDTHEKKDI